MTSDAAKFKAESAMKEQHIALLKVRVFRRRLRALRRLWHCRGRCAG